MADEHRVFTLTPGQRSPLGTTCRAVASGIMWIGTEGEFPTTVLKGKHLPDDLVVSTVYINRVATEQEIYDYNNPPEFQPIQV